MSEKNRQFDSFEQWAQQGLSWLSGHGFGRRAACFDSKGRPCRTEEDFLRARADDAFPVQWVAPDQASARLRPPPPAPPGWHDPGHTHNGALASAHPFAPNRTFRFAEEDETRRNQNSLMTKAAALGAIHMLTGQKADARPRHASESGPDSEERDAELAEILIHALEALHTGGALSISQASAATPVPAPEGHSLMAQAHAHTAKFAAQEEEKKSAHNTSTDAGPSGAGAKEPEREEEEPEEEDEEKEERHKSHRGDAERERREREAREAREQQEREARERQEHEEREAQKRREQEERAREAARRAEINHFEAFTNPSELTVDIMAVRADGAPVLLAHCDTMTSGVLAAHEIAALTDYPCRFVDPDLGEILPGDPLPENVTTWIETRLSPAPAYATPFDMTAPSPFA